MRTWGSNGYYLVLKGKDAGCFGIWGLERGRVKSKWELEARVVQIEWWRLKWRRRRGLGSVCLRGMDNRMRLRSSTRQQCQRRPFVSSVCLSPAVDDRGRQEELGHLTALIAPHSTFVDHESSFFGDCLPHAVVRIASVGCDVFPQPTSCNL